MKILSGEIRRGDFIVVSYPYSHIFGFFLRKATTIHYYKLYKLTRWLDSKSEKPPTVDYMPLSNWERFIKYDINLVTDTRIIAMYIKSIEALKKLKIIG